MTVQQCDAVRREGYRPFEGPSCERCGQNEQDCAWLLGCCGDCAHWTHYDDAGNPAYSPLGGRPRKSREHGTERGYQQHRSHHERSCLACRAAHNAHRRLSA